MYLEKEGEVKEYPQEYVLDEIFDKTKIMTEFVILGEDFPTDDVTKMLGILPTAVKHKGETIEGTERQCIKTRWEYSTGYEENVDVKEHLDKIMELFAPKEQKLREIKKKYHVEFILGVVPEIANEENFIMKFDVNFLRFASVIGLSFDIDSYIF